MLTGNIRFDTNGAPYIQPSLPFNAHTYPIILYHICNVLTTGVDALPFLYRVLHQLASRWNSLSLQLSVSGQDEIQRNARSADICLAVSLVEWLQSGQATWKALVEAVFRPAGGGHQVLARDIARNYRSEHAVKKLE